MTKSKTIKFKAALLLMVFSLNTLLGFACSLGLKMVYNEHHHDAEVVAPTTHASHHDHGSANKHSEEKKQHHPDSESSDDCCSNGVTSFNLIDKTVPHQVDLVHPVFFTEFPAAWISSGILPYINVTKNIKPFVRSHHPPIPDIRIAIQSFQI